MTSIPVSSTIEPVFPICRPKFPNGFTFGAASSAFQYESAGNVDGRGPSIWDIFCTRKGLVLGKGIDQHHRYKEDVSLMKWMGLDAYRFSISWSRIMPNGKKSGGLNPLGVQYYHNLIDELLAHGIKPYVTLFHWDLPQALEDEYGGFLHRNVIEDFKDYADVCFMLFGNKVKHWMTLNEPWTFSEGGYASGNMAPGRGHISDTSATQHFYPPTMCSVNPCCPYKPGDPAREPYLVTHHQLLAHAAVVQLYRTKYQIPQGGKIGLALNALWVEPLNPCSKDDVDATGRYLDFTFNWFLDPILKGSYPHVVQAVLKARGIPDFTPDESKILANSLDFLGINYYTASYVCDASKDSIPYPSYTYDSKIKYSRDVFLGEDWGAVDWIKVYPKGLMDLLRYVKTKYNGPIYITENGFGEKNVDGLLLHEACHDEKRVAYHHQHISYMLHAINKYEVDVRGYFTWSLMDNFEWSSGYNVRFGTIYIDYNDDLKRHLKFSAKWFKSILRKPCHGSGGLTDTGFIQNVPMSTPTDDPTELENGYVQEGEPLEAKKNLGSNVNSDPVRGQLDIPINSA